MTIVKYAEDNSYVLGIMVMIKYTGNNGHVHDIIC